MDRGAWRDTVHGVAKSQTWLSSQAHDVLARFICCNKGTTWCQLLVVGRGGGGMQELLVFSAQLGYELKSPLKISLAIKNKHTHAKDKHWPHLQGNNDRILMIKENIRIVDKSWNQQRTFPSVPPGKVTAGTRVPWDALGASTTRLSFAWISPSLPGMLDGMLKSICLSGKLGVFAVKAAVRRIGSGFPWLRLF